MILRPCYSNIVEIHKHIDQSSIYHRFVDLLEHSKIAFFSSTIYVGK